MFTVVAHENSVVPWIQTDPPADLYIAWLRATELPDGAGGDLAGYRHWAANMQWSGVTKGKCIPLESLNEVSLDCAFALAPTIGDNVRYTPLENLADIRLARIPRPGVSGKYTFAFGSCSHQERFGEHQPIWNAIVKDEPDCFFFIGDNIYLPSKPEDFPKSRDEMRRFYRERYDHQRRMPELQPLLRSTYCFGIWDDHDYGPNNADKTWQWKGAALEAFKAYFPGSYGLPDTPGCFQKFSWGDVDVFLLDDRTYRDPNNSTNPDKTMFGEAQLAWLKQGLAESKAGVKLVFNGNQMLSDRHPHESWGTYYRAERDAFLRWLWDARIGGVFFLSGDRHFAELIHKRDPKGIGSDVWELTSSPLANSHFAHGGMVKNRERIAKYTKGVNYGVVRVDSTSQPTVIDLLVKDVSGNVVIERRVKVAQ